MNIESNQYLCAQIKRENHFQIRTCILYAVLTELGTPYELRCLLVHHRRPLRLHHGHLPRLHHYQNYQRDPPTGLDNASDFQSEVHGDSLQRICHLFCLNSFHPSFALGDRTSGSPRFHIRDCPMVGIHPSYLDVIMYCLRHEVFLLLCIPCVILLNELDYLV